MQTTFHLAKRHRNLGIISLIFFLLIGVASAYGLWSSAPPERRNVAIYAVAFVAIFWAGFASLACWMLLAYWRERLTVKDGQITQQDVIAKRRIDLHSVTSVRWSNAPRPGGKIVVRMMNEKITIYLGNFEPMEQLWLIRYFRNELPTTIQENWDLFCSKIAVPLRDQSTLPNDDPGPDNVRIKRRRWDWYFLPVILLTAVIALVASWRSGQPRLLEAPLLPTLLWLFLRVATPRQGLVAKRMASEPGLKGFLVFELCWLGVAVAGLVIFRVWQPPMPLAVILGTTVTVAWFGVLFWKAIQLDYRRRDRDEANASIAVQRWDEGEQADGIAD